MNVPQYLHLLLVNVFVFIVIVNCDSTVNPDAFLNPMQIISRHGYAAESHMVETEDGFLLEIHRIPKSRNGTVGNQPIFLQHGLFASSICFIEEGNGSLAFILSDLGYDVWMGNARGNEYSLAHKTYLPSNPKFWNFTWHEMGIYDLPAVITYIVDKTNKPGEVLYAGHSMGTTMFFVFASLMPEVAANVKAMVALAPVAFMTHVTSPIRYLAPWVNDIAFIAKHLGINEFLPSNKIFQFLGATCLTQFERKICENLLFVIAGFDKQETDETTLEAILGHLPSSTSTKTVLHYLQEISNKGDFKQYDYGKDGNMRQYGQPTPPLYELEKIKVPMYLMYAQNDMLATPIDVQRLETRLTNVIGMYEVPLSSFNHCDFVFAKDAPELVYQNLTDTIKAYT